MVKMKHNKKRNALFIYEILTRELTCAILNEQQELKNKIIQILKEHFKKGTLIFEELQCYREALSKDIPNHLVDEFMIELEKKYDGLNKPQLFEEHSRIIKRINKLFDYNIFSNSRHFVPNYKYMATLYQLFNHDKIPVKTKVVLREGIKNFILNKEEIEKNKEEVVLNNLEMKQFIQLFNEQYCNSLFEEQKKALQQYIISNDDKDLEFKIYMNDEVGRLKKILKESLSIKEIKDDSIMEEKTLEVLKLLENMNKEEVNSKDMLKVVLKVQLLAREMQSND